MANYMTEIANMLGVEIGERFQVFDSVGRECPWKFYFTEKDLRVDGPNNCTAIDILSLLACGVYTIGRISRNCTPWKPAFYEQYYSIGPGGALEPGTWMNDFIDRMLYKLGNCYPTPQEAEANKDRWITFYTSDEVLWI